MMGFISSEYWWAFVLALALVPILYRAKANYISRCRSLGASSINTPRILIPVTVTLLLATALMRPYIGKEEITLMGSGRDILFLIDVSKSMRADDLHPSRLEVAKRKIKDAVRVIRDSGSRDRMGIVVFSGRATLYCPLTIDTAIITLYLESIDDEMTSDPGSSLLSAIQEALNTEAKTPLLILLSDGEDKYLEAAEIKKLVAEKGATLSAIGLGTLQGKPIPLEDGRFLKDRDGQIVISKLEENSLMSLTDGSGRYIRARLDDQDIIEVLTPNVDSIMNNSTTGEKIFIYGEIAPWLAAFSLLLLMYGLLKKSLPFAVLLISITAFSTIRCEADSLNDGYKAYSSGDYKKAEEIFRSKLASDNASQILESLGHSLYRQGRYNEAAAEYEKIAKTYSSKDEGYKGYYNLGNSKYMERKFKDAITAYDKALELRPTDKYAAFNKDLAKKRMEEEIKKEQEQDKDKEQEKDREQEKDQGKDQEKGQGKDQEIEKNKGGSSSENSNKSQESKSENKQERALESFLEGVDDALAIPKPSKRRDTFQESEQTW